MPESNTAVEEVFNNFVVSAGGELVSSLISNSGNGKPLNADYCFRSAGLISELKCLQSDPFGSNYKTKMDALIESWMKRRLLIVNGTRQISLKDLNPVCQEEWLKVLENPIATNILKQANRQIDSTKKYLDMPNAKGILFVSSDAYHPLPPNVVMFYLKRLLAKKKSDGQPQYSKINGIVYFSRSKLGYRKDTGVPLHFFCGGPRVFEDSAIRLFIDGLESLWYQLHCKATGTVIPRVVVPSNTIREITFVKNGS